MSKPTTAASVSLDALEPPAPWARPSLNNASQDLAVSQGSLGPGLRCTDDPELFFAESPDDVEAAKAFCHECPARAACLAGALERREPYGVWGGELFMSGVIVPRKRPRGRPRKTDVAA